MSAMGTTIDAIFLDVVEQLAFVYGGLSDLDDVEECDGTWISASLEFRSRGSGMLTLAVPTCMSAEIAAHILGLESEDIAGLAIAEDALKEMLNIVAGHVVPALQPGIVSFDLEVPKVERVEKGRCLELAGGPGATIYNLDGMPVILAMRLNEQAVR